MQALHRREILLGGLAAAAVGAPAGAAGYPKSLAFAAYRNGARIGEQQMTFETADGLLIVRTHAEFIVKFGPVVVFRYRHDAIERWRRDRFESLETRTDAGGKRESVVATHTPSGVVIATQSPTPATAPAGALPFTHWNMAIARAPLFNPQTGALLRQTVRRLGPSLVTLADGRRLQAQRISFTGDAAIDDWYDADGNWTALRGRLMDGSTLEYRRL
jgi:hypothetical protein